MEDDEEDFDAQQDKMEVNVRDRSTDLDALYSDGGFEEVNSAHYSAENFDSSSVNKETSAEYDADFDEDNDQSLFKGASSVQKGQSISSPLSANLFHAASFKAQSGFRLLPAEEPLKPAHLDTQSKTLQQDAQDTYGDDFEDDDESEHNEYTEHNGSDVSKKESKDADKNSNEAENLQHLEESVAASHEFGDYKSAAENSHEDVTYPSIDHDQVNRHLTIDNEKSLSDEASARESAVGHPNWAESLEGSYDDNGGTGRNMLLSLDIPQWTSEDVAAVAADADKNAEEAYEEEQEERKDEEDVDEDEAHKAAGAKLPTADDDEVQEEEELHEVTKDEVKEEEKEEEGGNEEEVEENEAAVPFEERYEPDPAVKESNIGYGHDSSHSYMTGSDVKGNDNDHSGPFLPPPAAALMSSESEAFYGEDFEFEQIRVGQVLEDSREADQSDERGHDDFETDDNGPLNQPENAVDYNEHDQVSEEPATELLSARSGGGGGGGLPPKDSTALRSLNKSAFTIQEVVLADLPLDFTELQEFYLKFQLGLWSECSSVLLSNQTLAWPSIGVACDVAIIDSTLAWCPVGAEGHGQSDMEIIVMENTANESSKPFAVGLLRLGDIVQAIRSSNRIGMTVELFNSNQSPIGAALVTASVDDATLDALVAAQANHNRNQEDLPLGLGLGVGSDAENPSVTWNEKLRGSYGEDFEQSSELLVSGISTAENGALIGDEPNSSANLNVQDDGNIESEEVVASTAFIDGTENRGLEVAPIIVSPRAEEEAALTEPSAIYGADFDESTADLSKRDGSIIVPVPPPAHEDHPEASQQSEADIPAAEARIADEHLVTAADDRVLEEQLSLAISLSHQNLQEGPESEPSPTLKPTADSSSSIVIPISDPSPNINPSYDNSNLIAGPEPTKPNPVSDLNPNPKQSKVLQSLREQVSNSRKNNSDINNGLGSGGRRPPVPKLSVLNVPGCNYTPAPTREEEDAEAIKLRKSRMNVRPWRDAQVPITKKDLLAQKKGQVRSTGGAMGSLEEEGYELQMHISKFCCHKILLSKCQEQGCKDANDKFQWLKFLYHKQKVATDIIEEADRLWRKKLQKSLEKALADLKADQEQEKKDVRAKMDEKSRAEQAIFDTLQHYSAVEKKVTHQVHSHFVAKDVAAQAQYKELVEKGIEGNLPAKVHPPKQLLYSDIYYKTIDRELFNASGGLTKDHCDFLRRRLATLTYHRDERFKDFIHVTKGVHEKQIEDMKDSISAPLKYLDRIRTTQMDSLRLFVCRVESSFRHSMMLSMVKREVLQNDVTREKALYASQMAYKCLKQSLAGIAKICAELPAIYTGITLTDYHNAMTDMIKQIRPPTLSPNRRRDAFSPPKPRATSKKGGKKKKKTKTAKEASPREEGVNLPSDGKGSKARPSTARPAAKVDGGAARRIKSANNNVNASSWVMSTEDENALDDENSEDEEHDLELDEARDTLHPLMNDVAGALPHDYEMDPAGPATPQRREKDKDKDTDAYYDTPSPKSMPKNKSSNSLLSFASHSHSEYSQVYEEEDDDESLYGEDFDYARKTLSNVESDVHPAAATLTRDASIQSFVSGIMEEAMSIVASPSRPNLNATSEFVPEEEIHLRSEETREFKSIMSIISNAINSGDNDIIEDNLPSQVVDKIESFAMTNESNKYEEDFAVESASKKINNYSSIFTQESSNPNLYEDDFVPEQSKIRSQLIYEDDFLLDEQEEDEEENDDAGRGDLTLPGMTSGKATESKRSARERRSREVWKLIAAEADAESLPNLTSVKERRKNMRGVIDGLIDNHRRNKAAKKRTDSKHVSSDNANPNPNPNPNSLGEMNWVVETIESDGEEEEEELQEKSALTRPNSTTRSSRNRSRLHGRRHQQLLCHFCGLQFDGEGYALPNTISEDIRIRKIVRRRLNQKYPVDIEGLMIPPSSPEHPKIGKAALSLRKQLEEEADDAFVKELIAKTPLNVKIKQKKGEPYLAKVFCSWECVKKYAMEDCPKQMRYERQMLIDLAAGYVVDC